MMHQKRDVPMLFTAEEISDKVAIIARQIVMHMPREIMIVPLLKGSFMFTADLVRQLYVLGIQPQIDFMTLSSYQDKTTSSGNVSINRDISMDVNGQDVLLVDDILESGRTLHYAREILIGRGAKSVRIAVLLEKPGKRTVDIHADYVGMTIPDKFVVGYGLDYANMYRELPYIGVIEVH